MQVLERNHVNVWGPAEQPAIVFGHGFGSDQRMWHPVARAFEATHRVVLFDHMGCGRAHAAAYDPRRHAQLYGYAQDLLEILATLRLEQVTFVGHSFSGMIGALAAIAEPQRFAQIFMLGASPRYLNDPPDYVGGFDRQDVDHLLDLMDSHDLGWAEQLARAAEGDHASESFSQALSSSIRAGDPDLNRRVARTIFWGDYRHELKRITVPCVIVQSRHDAIAPPEVAQYLQQHIPVSCLDTIDVTGHYYHLSHPEATLSLIRKHLRTHHACNSQSSTSTTSS